MELHPAKRAGDLSGWLDGGGGREGVGGRKSSIKLLTCIAILLYHCI